MQGHAPWNLPHPDRGNRARDMSEDPGRGPPVDDRALIGEMLGGRGPPDRARSSARTLAPVSGGASEPPEAKHRKKEKKDKKKRKAKSPSPDVREPRKHPRRDPDPSDSDKEGPGSKPRGVRIVPRDDGSFIIMMA